MKDEYVRDVLIKLLVAIIVFTALIIGICVYMFMPEKSENSVIENSSEIINNIDMINSVDNTEVISDDINNVTNLSI